MAQEQKIVSFDFDSTILKKEWDEEEGMEVPVGLDPRAAKLIKMQRASGNKVIIVTSRYGPKSAFGHDNKDIFAAAQELGGDPKDPKKSLPVNFTNGEDKVHTLIKLGVAKHYDDDKSEINAIKEKAPQIETPKLFVRGGKRKKIKEIIEEIVLQELEAYQRKIQKGYVKKRNKYLTTGPQKTSGTPYIIKPKKTRSKSAPSGFGGSEE